MTGYQVGPLSHVYRHCQELFFGPKPGAAELSENEIHWKGNISLKSSHIAFLVHFLMLVS